MDETPRAASNIRADVPPLTNAPRSAARRPPLRRLAIVLGVWIVLAGGALVAANALDSPVGVGARDEAQPAPTGTVATTTAAPAAKLPPFAMVLDRPLPKGVAGLAPVLQAEKLRLLAMKSRNPERFVELGSVLQVLGDTVSAGFSFQSALKFDPQSMRAQVGLAVIDGGTGPEGLARSAERLKALATLHPSDQLVSFNQAWVEIYRARKEPARAALTRTVALDPASRLGRTAAALLAALDKIAIGANP